MEAQKAYRRMLVAVPPSDEARDSFVREMDEKGIYALCIYQSYMSDHINSSVFIVDADKYIKSVLDESN